MIRRHRPLLALLLSLLLVGMQLQGRVHALEHLGEMLGHSPDHSLVLPAPDACAMCALFAGGANAIGCDAAEARVAIAVGENPPCACISFAPAAPSYYSSRAPPPLL